jgi:TonB family protein
MKAVWWFFALGFFASSTLAGPMKSGEIPYKDADGLMIYRPRIDYPLIARQNRITGSGVVRVDVNRDGIVTSVRIAQSTGSAILDDAALSLFKRCRFKPGRTFSFRSPITFTVSRRQF